MKRFIIALSALVLVLIVARASVGELFSTTGAAAQASSSIPLTSHGLPDVRQAVSFDVSPPLSSMSPAPAPQNAKQEAERENWMKPRSQR